MRSGSTATGSHVDGANGSRSDRAGNRFDQLIEAATRVLTSQSYGRTKMADIAREMGVAPGTLYLYVESKEALFHLLITRSLLEPDADPPENLPVPTPPPGLTLEFLRNRLTKAVFLPALEKALAGPPPDERVLANPPPDEPPGDVRAEVKNIVSEMYDTSVRYRTGINLIERSAKDWPEMYDLFYRVFLRGLIGALTRYLEDRTARGLLRPLPNPSVVARLILETVAWSAVHRHRDTFPVSFGDKEARETTVEILVNSLVPE